MYTYTRAITRIHHRVYFFSDDDYWVLETDYTGFSYVLGCVRNVDTPAGTCDGIQGWVWSRKPYLNGEQFIKVKGLIDQYCIDDRDYFTTGHDKGKKAMVTLIPHFTTPGEIELK